MRLLSGRSRLAKTLIAATTVLVTATAGMFVGVGIANATATGPSGAQFNFSVLMTKTDTAQRPPITSTSWTQVATLSLFPNGFNANHALVRFSAQSKCQAGSSDGWCTVRILVNNAEAAPADGSNFVWQWEGNNETWGARSMERTMDTFLGSTVTVTVQAAVHGGATSFILQDWILSAQAY